LELAVSVFFRLERLIDEKDLRSVRMNPSLVAGEMSSAALGERFWLERGAMVYTICNIRGEVVCIVKWEPFKECAILRGAQSGSGELLFGHCADQNLASLNQGPLGCLETQGKDNHTAQGQSDRESWGYEQTRQRIAHTLGY